MNDDTTDKILSAIEYSRRLERLTAKELILEVLSSTAADYCCVTELMNRVMPNWNETITDAETEAHRDESPEKYEPLKNVPVGEQYLAEINRLKAEIERLDRSETELIEERDYREEIIDELCAAVGHRNGFEFEWTSAYGYHDAIDDVENIVDALRAEVKRLSGKAADEDSAVVMSLPQSPSVPAVAGGGEDARRLDWLFEHGLTVYHMQGTGAWSAHYSTRDAIDAAIAATKAKEGKL